jgi:rhodanese-related sulfurtransferase
VPRRFTARASGPIEYLAIDSELLDVMITWDQTGTYEVADLQAHLNEASDGDWMTTLLRNRALQRLPAANLQALFSRMERMPVRAGEVLIRQGETGDWFYVLVSGRCVVMRETPLNRDGIKLAEFTAGDSFGEEALISDTPRSATVTMLSDGVVMRLHKNDFLELLGDPLIERIPHAEALRRVADGGTWLDVRLPAEYQNLAIDGAVNIPLYFLRLKLSVLDPRRQYVVYCGDGRRSAAAAFILAERGFDARVLDQGITAVDSGLRRAAAEA